MQVTQLVALCFVLDDFQRFTNMAVLTINGLMCLYKGVVLIANADRLWSTLQVAGYGFARSCVRRGGCPPDELLRCRATLSLLLRTFVLLSYVTLVIWITGPIFSTNEYMAVDGYRTTINNLWTPLPPSVYNLPSVWALIYLIETFMLVINVFCWTIFDCYLITMCFALNAQFHTMSAGYETLGWCRRLSTSSDNSIYSDVMELDYYDELICHIENNKQIIKKLDDFFDIVQPVVLVQIFNGSFSVLTLIFLLLLLYLMGLPITSHLFMKFLSGLVSVTIELYIYCYAFNYTEIKKSTVNFGLYSSNWTTMDLKFKKTMLLAIMMNNAHTRVMKITSKSIINLGMFVRVINIAYSIVPVLLNLNVAK